MERKKRTRDFELTLRLSSDDFISPPRSAQRNWLVNRALSEFGHDLLALDRAASRFVPGVETGAPEDRTQSEATGEEIMEDWQLPIMSAMADIVTEEHGDVLEIGFGRGVSAAYIQERGVRSHTIVECSDSIVADLERWKAGRPDRDIRVVHARWQDAVDDLGEYDGVFFHTYPLNEEEFIETVLDSTTFAEHFFPTAARLLRPGGVFTYMTNEIDSFSREHQRLLLKRFRSITLQVVSGLTLPVDVRDAWWASSMVVAKAVK